jgi:hypothetical protein
LTWALTGTIATGTVGLANLEVGLADSGQTAEVVSLADSEQAAEAVALGD